MGGMHTLKDRSNGVPAGPDISFQAGGSELA
jgi:hypothetical protein